MAKQVSSDYKGPVPEEPSDKGDEEIEYVVLFNASLQTQTFHLDTGEGRRFGLHWWQRRGHRTGAGSQSSAR